MTDDIWKRRPDGAIECSLVRNVDVARGSEIIAIRLELQSTQDPARGEVIQIALDSASAIRMAQAILEGVGEVRAIQQGRTN